MSRTPEELYFELGHLVADMPDLTTGAITPEVTRWLQRAAGLVERTGGSLADTIQLKVAADNLDGLLRARNAHTIVTIVHRALARVELKVPPEGRGAFVAVGNAFEAFAAMRKILASATSDVLFVDARAEATILTDYAVLAPEAVTVRVLTEQAAHSEFDRGRRAPLGKAVRRGAAASRALGANGGVARATDRAGWSHRLGLAAAVQPAGRWRKCDVDPNARGRSGRRDRILCGEMGGVGAVVGPPGTNA